MKLVWHYILPKSGNKSHNLLQIKYRVFESNIQLFKISQIAVEQRNRRGDEQQRESNQPSCTLLSNLNDLYAGLATRSRQTRVVSDRAQILVRSQIFTMNIALSKPLLIS